MRNNEPWTLPHYGDVSRLCRLTYETAERWCEARDVSVLEAIRIWTAAGGDPDLAQRIWEDPDSVGAADWRVTDRDIQALSTEAGEAGDLEQVALCDRALDGDEYARRICEDGIYSTRREALAD